MDWVFVSLFWYFSLLLLGLIFFPFARRLFPNFLDQGYAFSRTIAILALSYTMFILGIIKLAPFSQTTLFVLVGLFAALSLYVLRRFKLPPIRRYTLYVILFEELLFLAALLFLAYIRGQEPSIRGLEKFMDFGFMNSILRSTYFPPLDIWLSADPARPQGYPINYYYFGHLTGAVLIKLTSLKPTIAYNLILATILAQGITQGFSIVTGILVAFRQKLRTAYILMLGLIGTFLINFAGNLHTIYLFTKGYDVDAPRPFWEILSGYNPASYWYPNATRFIPFTIHEFPSYSYVVADLHGHVFDIPFVLLTIALLFKFLKDYKDVKNSPSPQVKKSKLKHQHNNVKLRDILARLHAACSRFYIPLMLGFLLSIHYMTNAFDGPIYLLLTGLVLLTAFGISKKMFVSLGVIVLSFALFALPFSLHFAPFVSGIGVNCAPDALVALQKLGPFLFEQGNCQASSLWMLFVLWGFFLVNFVLFLVTRDNTIVSRFVFILFGLGTILILIPEFFYIKDIYPSHFRANTMFKLGYQAFIMMSIASTITLAYIWLMRSKLKLVSLFSVFLLFFFFVAIYPLFSFRSYYGDLKKPPQLDGATWLAHDFPQDKEIIDYLNTHVMGQPVILEAQGDSYTDYERISAYTGLPTVAGWWVHEWLWRGSSDVVGGRIPDISAIYESQDLQQTKKLLEKYQVEYIIVSGLEREKYPAINESKFATIGTKIFESTNGFGALYKVE